MKFYEEGAGKKNKGSYVFQYDRLKLEDYCLKKLLERYHNGIKEDYRLRSEIGKKVDRDHLEALVGENLFWVINRDECIYNHYHIAKNLDEYCAGEDYGAWTAFGWIITHKWIKKMEGTGILE